MSLAQGFKIRYGNADELDNYDPTVDVYDNQTFIGGTQYNIFQKPQYDETISGTILNDENGDGDENRLIVSNRCLIGDGVSTLDVQGNLTGSFNAKGWATTSGSGGWALTDLSLIGGVLTLASGTYYKTIERYVNGELFDHVPLEDAPSGFDGEQALSTTGENLTLTSSDYTLLRTVRNDIPWDAAFGDRYGYGVNKLVTIDKDNSTLAFAGNRYVYTYTIGGGSFTLRNATNSLDDNGDAQGWLFLNNSEYEGWVINTYDEDGDQGRGLEYNGVIPPSDLTLKLIPKSATNLPTGITIEDSIFRNRLISELNSRFGADVNTRISTVREWCYCLNGGTDQGGAYPNGIDDDYPNTTLGINIGNGYDIDATSQDFRDAFDAACQDDGNSSNFLDVILKGNTLNLSHNINYFTKKFENNFSGVVVDELFTYTQTVTEVLSNSAQTSRYEAFFQQYERILYEYRDLTITIQSNSIKSWIYWVDLDIEAKQILPASKSDITLDTSGNPLAFGGKKQFQGIRINNQSGYFDTGTALVPISGSIGTITDIWGTARFAEHISGYLECTASGTCHGIKTSNGMWYTFSEGYFGEGSEYIYDVSGSGYHLEVSGQAPFVTWQGVRNEEDKGYDWLSIYGGCVFTNGTPDEDIFIPNLPNTTTVVTTDFLPSGYSLDNHYDAGVYVRSGTEWLLASGQVSEYRSELDEHIVGTTPFTESKQHYVTEVSANNFGRWVLYPENLSEPANTNVDFEVDEINPIAITFQAADITELSQMNGSYTKAINLPATSQNSDLFDYIYDPNNADFGSLKGQKDAEITVDGLEILRGKANVESVIKRDIARSFKMYVQGDNYTLFDDLDDILISGLDFGTFELTKANVEATWDYDSDDGNVVFAPYDFGQFSGDSLLVSDMPPCFFIRNILTKGFDEMGIAYESNWLDSNYAKRLVLPFVGEYGLSDSDFDTISGNNTFSALQSGTLNLIGDGTNKIRFSIPDLGSSPNYTQFDSEFTVSGASYIQFELNLEAKYDSLAPNNGLIIGYDVNGQTVVQKKVFTVNTATFTPISIPIKTHHLYANNDSVKPFIICNQDVDIKNISWSSNVKQKLPEGATLTLNEYIPSNNDDEFSVFDLLQGLAQLFNLYFYYNPFKKTLKFEPYTDFYSGELDWSNKWDNRQDAEIKYLGLQLNQKIRHKYKDDSKDELLDQYSRNGVPYASYRLELDKNFKKGETEIQNSLFAPTVDRNVNYRNTAGIMPKLQIKGDNENQESLDFQPRILYYAGKDIGGAFSLAYGAVTRNQVETYNELPRLAFREKKLAETAWQSLAFDSYTDIRGQDRAGLFETYFVPKYRNVAEGITATYYLNLTITDVVNEPLTKIIFLDDAYWTINKIIDFNPISQEATQVELLKVIDFDIAVTKTKRNLIDRITGERPERISYKPSRDLQQNGGFDFSDVPSGIAIGDSDIAGSTQGVQSRTPKRGSSFGWGRGLETYYENQYIFGTFNQPNEDAIFQVGAGTTSGDRVNAMELVESDNGYELYVGDARVLVSGQGGQGGAEYYNASGVQLTNPIIMQGAVNTNSGGTADIYFTDDGTSSGTLIFSEVPSVTISINEPTEFAKYRITGLTISGFDIDVRNDGGTGISTEVNFHAIGE